MKQRGKMFNQLYLIIEENKLKKRFKGNVVTAVLEVLNKETDVQRLELIYNSVLIVGLYIGKWYLEFN